MNGTQDKRRAITVFFIIFTILLHLLFFIPTTYADGQIFVSFDPKANDPPFKPINPSPANGSVDVPSSPTLLCVDVYDPSNITVNVFFYNAFNGSLIGIDYDVSCMYDWSTASVNWSETERGSVYSWYAIVDDNQYQNTSDTFYFATRANQPPVISNPSPANGTQAVSITTPYWNATIEDPENDVINWTIQTIPNIGSASGNTSNASCSISGLNCNTIYTIYVNATDTGSGQWTNETFWFETASPGAPTISNEYPPNRSTHIELQPTCQIDVQDLEGDNLTIYWYENSTGSWILRQTDSNDSNATVSWVFTQANTNGQWWYWKVNVSDGENYTEDIYNFYAGYQSKIDNTGSTNIKGYLLIQVEYNDSGTWLLEDETINESSPRTINSGSYLKLDYIFNDIVNTSVNLSQGSGTYRVYAAFRNPNGNVLQNDDGTYMNASYEFTYTTGVANNPPTQESQKIWNSTTSTEWALSEGPTGVSLMPTSFNITISDSNGDKMNITILENNSGSWKTVNQTSGTGLSDGTYNFTNTSWVDSFETKYWISFNLTDGEDWTNETYNFVTGAENGSINVTPATWSQGELDLGTSNETTGNYFTITNEGIVVVNITIKASNATNATEVVKWLLNASPDHNNFTFQYNKSTDPSWTAINTSYDVFLTNLAIKDFKLFDLKIFMATSATASTLGPLTVTITFKSVKA